MNARIRAMKSYLFDRPFIEKLLLMPDMSEIVAILGKSDYRGDIEKGVVKFPGVAGVEDGLKSNLVKTYRKILKLVEGHREAERLVKVLFARWDVHNLRTIIRAKHIDADREEVEDQLVPAGELDDATLNELLKLPDIRACANLLMMWGFPHGRPISDGYQEYAETKNLADLELRLDKFFYEYAYARSRGSSMNCRLVQELTRREIDFVNLMTLFRLARERVDEEKLPTYFMANGRELGVDKLLELAKLGEVDDIIAELDETSYHPVLSEGLKRYFETGSVSVLERRMEEHNIRKSISLFRADPLSIALIVAYSWAKFNETVNLRIILRGKVVGMPDDRIREALVLA